MAEYKCITRYFEIENNLGLFEDNIHHAAKGFTPIGKIRVPFADIYVWESSVFHYEAGSTVNVFYNGRIEITGLEKAIEEAAENMHLLLPNHTIKEYTTKSAAIQPQGN